jgi:hypothetical protein
MANKRIARKLLKRTLPKVLGITKIEDGGNYIMHVSKLVTDEEINRLRKCWVEYFNATGIVIKDDHFKITKE